MLALLVSDGPRRSADRILNRLVQIHLAAAGPSYARATNRWRSG